MKKYLDNASTSFPKPEGVVEAMTQYMSQMGCNINRGGYADAYESAEVVFDTRCKLCKLFDFDIHRNVVFTMNVTEALNMIIKELLLPGDHCLVSAMEHNAVMRPLVQMTQKGVTFDRFPCNEQGELIIDQMEECLRENTKAVIMTSASNVCGTMMPLKEVGEFCKRHHLIFVVDAAQAAGVEPISMKEMNIDILAFTGHKSLLGPQGTGGFLIREEFVSQMPALIAGGTGSFSDSEQTPTIMPDKYEAGTMNVTGIYGLHGALTYLEKVGISTIRDHELAMTQRFIDGMEFIEGIRVIGKKDIKGRTAVVSIQCDFCDEATLAFELDHTYDIMTRVGLHCAPNAHKTLGTFPRGTIRFSFGFATTTEEVDAAVEAIEDYKSKIENNH